MTVDEQLAILRRGTSAIVSEDDLRKKLSLGRPLRVKLGLDPTAKDITLGWAVVLRKIRDFQRLGHTGCIIVGNFTAQIGDPTGKSKTRRQLTRDEVMEYVASIQEKLFKILIPERTQLFYNEDWLGKMTFADVIRLTSKYTVARILERDDFTKRLANQQPVSMHEILYPLCQGMDSVEIDADIELGGNDQLFNNLVGRNLMESYGLAPQVVMTCPLLVGTDGKEKMSQSLGNYVSITDAPNDIFGKTMSIPDDLIANWFELCTDVPTAESSALLADGQNPRNAKMRLAREIVSLYHGDAAGLDAENYFVDTFVKRQQPVEAEPAEIPADAVADGFVSIPALVVGLGLAKSNGAAKDLVKAGAVALDGERVTELRVPLADVSDRVLKVGKHAFRRLHAGS
ncbi:MAG: tyrosine--tRNA ligase [Fimbriimonadaceae bacterium]|nr:tyrosine--tRNA ligase [Fimbriimonadaceae bacterium]